MDAIYDSLTTRVLNVQNEINTQRHAPSRTLIALAGVPGAGKSTIAREVVNRLNKLANAPYATLLPMDGFHLPRHTLDMLPDSAEAYARRGAPWTFHAHGVVNLVKLLDETRRDGSWLSKSIKAPGFDHVVKDPVSDAITVSPGISVVILEGNWLLLDENPWSAISAMVDDTWFVDTAPELARERIAKRHIQSGIESTWYAAVSRAEYNDLPNGELARSKLIRSNITIRSVEEGRSGVPGSAELRAL